MTKNHKLRNLYNAVDLSFCLSRHENIPYSVIESMSVECQIFQLTLVVLMKLLNIKIMVGFLKIQKFQT